MIVLATLFGLLMLSLATSVTVQFLRRKKKLQAKPIDWAKPELPADAKPPIGDSQINEMEASIPTELESRQLNELESRQLHELEAVERHNKR